jgi:hypothetical protein
MKLKQLCRENKIPLKTKKTSLKQNSRGQFYTKQYIYSYKFDELIKMAIKKISLEEIVKFAKRNSINIRDISDQIQKRKAEEEVQRMIEKGGELDQFYLEVITSIRSFEPFMEYNAELPYQIDLARWLQTEFPNTTIEESRGSTRPDIIIRNIAIEVKGPTYPQDLRTISDKCMRYRQYFPGGMIVVLFDVSVNQHRYNDWFEGMKTTFPNVMIIRK